MKNYWLRFLDDTAGAETAEWLVVVALLSTITVSLYFEILQEALTGVVSYVGGLIPD